MSGSEPPHRQMVLLAVLDWGLGHATRMIPVAREVLHQGMGLVIASSGEPLELLRREFPEVPCEELPSYRVRYSKRGTSLPIVLLRQLPRLLSTTREERRAVSELADRYGVTVVLSDNRFGARSGSTTNIFITHQLFIRTPAWMRPARWMSRLLNLAFIRQFDECWIPDFGGKVNLSGELSHRRRMPFAVRYIGPLSRFGPIEDDPEETYLSIDLLIILSGPEPQRSQLEKTLAAQAKACSLNTTLVRGTALGAPITGSAHLKVIDMADSRTLFGLMRQSRLILCRSGYSSIMDLAATGRDAILVPTPGQTEQEYLAARLMKQGVFFSMKQSSFDLGKALEASQEYTGLKIQKSDSLLSGAITYLEGL